jgi:hypothetical protein
MRVHPRAQIVWSMVFCVTAGLIAPGVVDASGSELCARAPLANRVARTKIADAPDHIAACLLVAGALRPAAPAKGIAARSHGSRASCQVRLTPPIRHAPPSLRALRRQPTTRNGGKGGGIGSLVRGALSIITKSCPDNHLRIEADASELGTGRPSRVRPRHSTSGRRRCVATCTALTPRRHLLERGSVAEVHLDPLVPRAAA